LWQNSRAIAWPVIFLKHCPHPSSSRGLELRTAGRTRVTMIVQVPDSFEHTAGCIVAAQLAD
jgi:hypothetical protein